MSLAPEDLTSQLDRIAAHLDEARAAVALITEGDPSAMQELKPEENPMQHELVAEPFDQRDGWVDVPRRPGLGVEVDEAVLRRYRLG